MECYNLTQIGSDAAGDDAEETVWKRWKAQAAEGYCLEGLKMKWPENRNNGWCWISASARGQQKRFLLPDFVLVGLARLRQFDEFWEWTWACAALHRAILGEITLVNLTLFSDTVMFFHVYRSLQCWCDFSLCKSKRHSALQFSLNRQEQNEGKSNVSNLLSLSFSPSFFLSPSLSHVCVCPLCVYICWYLFVAHAHVCYTK